MAWRFFYCRVTNEKSVLLNIDSFVLLINKYEFGSISTFSIGYEMAIALDQYSKIMIHYLIQSFYAQIQNQTYVVKYKCTIFLK